MHDQLVDIPLIGEEVTGGVLEISILSLLVPTSLGPLCLWSAMPSGRVRLL